MYNFAGIELKGRVLLAPMAGVTNLTYRRFMKPFGVALSYSEMISDCGLCYGNKQTMEYIKTSPDDRPCALQLFGSSIESTVKAIGILEKNADYDILDINLGCPVYKVTRTGAGSAWLKRPEELREYLTEVVKASSKPVTVKIRLGWDTNSINVHQIVKIIEEAGCKGFAVHARTTQQGYSGAPNWEEIRDLYKETSLPFAVSGDIYSPEDAIKAMEITGAQFVMVARGGMGRPQLISQINEALNNEPIEENPTLEEQINYAEKYATALLDDLGEYRAIPQLRGILPHFFSGFPGYKKYRLIITESVKSKDDLIKVLNGFRKNLNIGKEEKHEEES